MESTGHGHNTSLQPTHVVVGWRPGLGLIGGWPARQRRILDERQWQRVSWIYWLDMDRSISFLMCIYRELLVITVELLPVSRLTCKLNGQYLEEARKGKGLRCSNAWRIGMGCRAGCWGRLWGLRLWTEKCVIVVGQESGIRYRIYVGMALTM